MVAAGCLALNAVGFGFGFGSSTVLRDVSLTARPGRVVGLLGPNGAGKSTVLRLAAGLLRPRTGTVCLDGVDIARRRRVDVARRIAVVPQEAELPPGYTGEEVVLMGRSPHLGRWGRAGAEDTAAARRALERAGAAALADRPAAALSGGEGRRLLLAQALAQEPAVLLLDEPTAHLDLAHQLAVRDLIVWLARSSGLAVLAVFHDLNLAAETCDEVLLLSEGRVAARGNPTVLTPALLHAVFGVDVAVVPHPHTGRAAFLPPGTSAPPLEDAP